MATSNELLLKAAKIGDSAALSKALQARADIETKPKTANGLTASMLAANNGHVDCLSLLVKAGADVDAKDSNGWTASMWAASRGHGHVDYVQLIESEIERRAIADAASLPFAPKQRSSLRV